MKTKVLWCFIIFSWSFSLFCFTYSVHTQPHPLNFLIKFVILRNQIFSLTAYFRRVIYTTIDVFGIKRKSILSGLQIYATIVIFLKFCGKKLNFMFKAVGKTLSLVQQKIGPLEI
jgi:hypothetical protein